MTVHAYQCVGIFRPGDFNDSTESSSTVPGSKPTVIEHENLVLVGSSWDGWSPARIRAARAEGRARTLAARKAYAEQSAAALAAAPRNYIAEPEPGATPHDIRVYTRLTNGQYKYWGVRDEDMTIEEFWEEKDPDNTRDRDGIHINPRDLPPPENWSLSNSLSTHNSTAPSSGKTQKTPHANPQYRIKKPATVSPSGNKSTRKPQATMLDARRSGLGEQVRDIMEGTLKGRRSAAHLANVEQPDAQARESRKRSDADTNNPVPAPKQSAGRERPRKVQHGVIEDVQRSADPAPSSPAKRKRGRPFKTQPTPKFSVKQSRPAAENKVKITKPKRKHGRPLVPSTHTMCTRARGPAGRSHLA